MAYDIDLFYLPRVKRMMTELERGTGKDFCVNERTQIKLPIPILFPVNSNILSSYTKKGGEAMSRN